MSSVATSINMSNGVKGTAVQPTSTWTEDKENIVLGPYAYLLGCPGKNIRKQLISAFNVWLNVPDDVLETISNVIAMLHTASLLVDDVEDNSELRRGVPVAHSIFGVAQTINSANYVYFRALNELGKLKDPKCLSIYTEELMNLHRGQGMDLYWRDNLSCPTEEDYLEMVSNKTGGLFRLAVKLMQASSTNKTDYIPLVDCIGMVFQIRDDYLNLRSSKYQDNKGYCEDLTEGKFSYPIIHSIRQEPGNMQILSILKQRTDKYDIKKYAVRYMEQVTDSFTYTRAKISALDVQARRLIDSFGGNLQLIQILDKLVIDDSS